jgi:hypothetical protein
MGDFSSSQFYTIMERYEMEDLEMICGLMFEIVSTVMEMVHLKLSIIGLATSGKTCARTCQEIAGLNPR